MFSVFCLRPVVVRLHKTLYRKPQGLAGPSSVEVLEDVVDFNLCWALTSAGNITGLMFLSFRKAGVPWRTVGQV